MKDGPGTPAPQSGYRRYFYLLWNYFWTFALINLLFIAFSIPLVTLPAALCAANRVCIIMVREGHVFLWTEFWMEFKRSFLKCLLMGLLFGLFLFASYYLLSLGLTNSMNIYGFIFNALGIMWLILTVLWGGYAFVLTAMLDLPAGVILKNAFSLMMLAWKRSLGVLGVEALMVVTAVALYPFSAVLLLFCWFGLAQYTLCFLINGPVETYIFTPHDVSESRENI